MQKLSVKKRERKKERKKEVKKERKKERKTNKQQKHGAEIITTFFSLTISLDIMGR